MPCGKRNKLQQMKKQEKCQNLLIKKQGPHFKAFGLICGDLPSLNVLHLYTHALISHTNCSTKQKVALWSSDPLTSSHKFSNPSQRPDSTSSTQTSKRCSCSLPSTKDRPSLFVHCFHTSLQESETQKSRELVNCDCRATC